jgi:hypothetical protein
MSEAERGSGAEVLVGILMQRWPNQERPFGALTPFAQRVSGLAATAGVSLFGFGPDDLDIRRKRVRASQYCSENRGWTLLERPLPDVVWNRYYRGDRSALFSWLGRTGLLQINDARLDKWEAYQLLSQDPRMAPHLPETAQLTKAAVALAMAGRHPVIYIKPVAGSAGRGIMRCRLAAPGLLCVQYISRETGARRESHVNASQLDQWLAGRRRPNRYIVQQGLSLAVFHGRPADVRVLVQKDDSGLWQVTGMGARVAAHDRFTANLHTGGSAVPLGLLGEAITSQDLTWRESLEPRLESLAIATVQALERGAGGLGELGIDFGVDGEGRIWYIEQNAQPGRAIFDDLGRRDLSEIAHLRPLQYARFLAKAGSPKA